ncbi:hypothetical protein BCV70DRAFT_199885 [Testicularia cyperi]|uniref:Uncharacterized protein n=1 Tax=Testicularia cyperi TaxID=1882483 RepID=A0A317XTJ0_9BASI|nr:hypothetical protein BCV70DRAFT_199885 [Testicularia cyperi]
MASPLRRSTRSTRQTEASLGTPEPTAISASPSPSPTKLDRKRKRDDEQNNSIQDAPATPKINGAAAQPSGAVPASASVSIGTETQAPSHAQHSATHPDEVDTDTRKSQLSKPLQELLGLPGSRTATRRNKKHPIRSTSDSGSAAQGMNQAESRDSQSHMKTEEAPSTSSYALHMRLPRADYFSRAVELTREQLANLDPGQADIVEVTSQSSAYLRALRRSGLVSVPTLGERMNRPRPPSSFLSSSDEIRRASERVNQRPVTFLRYGNYASFAPTHDSLQSTSSYNASQLLWHESAHRLAAETNTWGPRPFQVAVGEGTGATRSAAPPTPSTLRRDRISASALATASAPSSKISIPGPASTVCGMDMDVDGDEDADGNFSYLGLDVELAAFRSSLEQLDRDEAINAHLRFNMMLLHHLQEFQWARLRESYDARSDGLSIHTDDVRPSREEEAIAALLVESLGSLIALQPQAVDPESQKLLKVTPDASKVETFAHSSGAIDPQLLGDSDAGYWGTLDRDLAYQTKIGVPPFEAALLLRDKVTVRLTDESASKAKRTARRSAYAGAGVEDRRAGTLDRVASSRSYDGKKDRHDVEPRAEAAADRPAGLYKTPSGSMTRLGTSPGAVPARHADGSAASSGPPGASMLPPQHTPQRPSTASYAFATPGSGLTPGQPRGPLPGYNYAGRPLQGPVSTGMSSPAGHSQYSPHPVSQRR